MNQWELNTKCILKAWIVMGAFLSFAYMLGLEVTWRLAVFVVIIVVLGNVLEAIWPTDTERTKREVSR